MNGLIKRSDVNQAGHLQIAGVDALELAAKYQTPLQVFDVGRIRQAIRAFKRVFGVPPSAFDREALITMQRAVEQATVPDTLRGRAFGLTLVLERGEIEP